MSTDESRALVRRFMAALESRGDLADLDQVCSSEVADAWRGAMEAFSFTDRTFTVDEMIAAGSKVAILWTTTGRHTSDYLGIPATGRRTSNHGSAFFTVDGGRITDVVSYFDSDGLLRQLGATIQPPA
jgi:steroid delta-isomerase-like uncharacterized protein